LKRSAKAFAFRAEGKGVSYWHSLNNPLKYSDPSGYASREGWGQDSGESWMDNFGEPGFPDWSGAIVGSVSYGGRGSFTQHLDRARTRGKEPDRYGGYWIYQVAYAEGNGILYFKGSMWRFVPPNGISSNPSSQGYLSEHLKLSDAIYSQTAKERGINNTPSSEHLAALKALGGKVYDPIYNHFNGNIKISSGYRSVLLNAAVGGSNTSQHSLGEALDIVGVNGVENSDIFNYIRNNLDYNQIIWEFGDRNNPAWVHVGYKSTGNLFILTRATGSQSNPFYSPF